MTHRLSLIPLACTRAFLANAYGYAANIRYLAEFQNGTEREHASQRSLEAYCSAQKLAESDLSPTNPIRLGLILNFSVFYYEILNQKTVAVQLAKRAFDSSIAELDNLSEESYKDSTVIMQLLRDNLTMWTSSSLELDGDDLSN